MRSKRSSQSFAVIVEPAVDVAQRLELDAAEVLLRRPASGDEAGLLQHADMFGDGTHGEREGLRQLGDRGFAVEKPGQDRPACGVRERGECVVEGDFSRHCGTI